MSGERPWRAAAYLPSGTGYRVYVGSTSAKTRAGLQRFTRRWAEVGAVVDEWEVQPIHAVACLTQITDSPGG